MRIDRTRVEQLMTRDVKTCGAHDTLSAVAKIMWNHDCGCVPVVDDDGRLVGILSLNDIALEAAREHVPPTRNVSPESFTETMAAVCEHRSVRSAAAA